MQNLLLLNAHLLRVDIPEKLFPHLNKLLEWTELLTTAMADSNAKTLRKDCLRVYQRYLYGNTSRVMQAVALGQHLSQVRSLLLCSPFAMRSLPAGVGTVPAGKSKSKLVYQRRVPHFFLLRRSMRRIHLYSRFQASLPLK